MALDYGKELDFSSEFFSLYKVSNNTYGAISKENSGMGGNAGFVDLGDIAVLIDTTMSEEAAKDLRKAVIQYTGKNPKFIVITHYHLDHVVGNSVFDSSISIITSERTLNNIKVENAKRIKDIRNTSTEEVDKMEESLKSEIDEEKRKEIENELNFIKLVKDESFALRNPDLCFRKELILHGKDRDLHIHTFQKAHTNGDVVVYVPDDEVLFAGDLLFARSDPWLGSGDPDGWISVIDKILAMNFATVVPGHGNLASKKEFSLEKKYIREIIQLAKNHLKTGDPIKREDFSSDLKKWTSPVLQWNIDFLENFLKK
jgi:glyoxylase-like metal-dependent hydrolase (beta-lactamase superfamily II)